jgi:hypothetical protein
MPQRLKYFKKPKCATVYLNMIKYIIHILCYTHVDKKSSKCVHTICETAHICILYLTHVNFLIKPLQFKHAFQR